MLKYALPIIYILGIIYAQCIPGCHYKVTFFFHGKKWVEQNVYESRRSYIKEKGKKKKFFTYYFVSLENVKNLFTFSLKSSRFLHIVTVIICH